MKFCNVNFLLYISFICCKKKVQARWIKNRYPIFFFVFIYFCNQIAITIRHFYLRFGVVTALLTWTPNLICFYSKLNAIDDAFVKLAITKSKSTSTMRSWDLILWQGYPYLDLLVDAYFYRTRLFRKLPELHRVIFFAIRLFLGMSDSRLSKKSTATPCRDWIQCKSCLWFQERKGGRATVSFLVSITESI